MAKKIKMKAEKPIEIMPGSKGILLIALGHRKYLEMAVNLAMSIKSKENIPIAIYCSNISAISEKYQELFDYKIIAKADLNAFGEKLRVNEISPFETTIYLDVDMLALPKQIIAPLFDFVSDEQPITFQSRGFCEAKDATKDSSAWCNIVELIEACELPENARIYNLHSEVVVWKKSVAADGLFREAKSAFDNPKVSTTNFAGGVADEFGYITAVAKLSQFPHSENWICSFWAMAEKWPRTEKELYSRYHFMSMGGNRMPQPQIALYDNLVKYYSQKMGFDYQFKFKNKRNYLPERNNI